MYGILLVNVIKQINVNKEERYDVNPGMMGWWWQYIMEIDTVEEKS